MNTEQKTEYNKAEQNRTEYNNRTEQKIIYQYKKNKIEYRTE